MKRIREEYRELLSHSPSILACLTAFALFLLSLVINYFASQYAFIRKDNPVTDLLLDNLPVIDMSGAFVSGTIIFLIFIVIFMLGQPKRIPFTLKAVALFITVRSIFVTLTHIGPSPLNTLTSPSEIGKAFTSGADLFFSGHTGMPFLFALMFWSNKTLRYVFITISVLAAAGVLLGHIHYSIDVASAYFITHGIYLMAQKFFKKDYENFHNRQPWKIS